MTDPALFAHRGFADEYPENTLLAFRRAARVADGVELDVRRCGSGELVVVHDATVDRVTDRTGRVDALSRAELAAADVLGSGEGIPTLAEALDAVPDGVAVNVELKERGTAADAFAAAADVGNDVIVSSFDAEALREARAADPAVPRAYLFGEDAAGSVAVARELDCEYVHPQQWLALRSRVVERAHDAGMRVNAWTVASALVARLLARRGVDGVVADRPVLAGARRTAGR